MRPAPVVCILAGGLGSRLGEITTRIPKPLVEVAGEPFLAHQLRLLARFGLSEVVLCVGHLGGMIEDTFGPRFGESSITYSYDDPGLNGTLGAIRKALPLLGERFLVLYGDTYLRLDYDAAWRAWDESALPALMTVLRNAGRWDHSNAIYRDGRVLTYDKAAPTPEMAWIDYGLGGLDAGILDRVGETTSDLADLYRVLAQMGLLFGYEATERFYEIGSPDALAETEAFLLAESGRAG